MNKITLLNGESWNKESLLYEMQDDQFYYGHLGQHALSSTSLKQLLDSPKSYYFQQTYGSAEKQAFNIGRLTHMLALEPNRFDDVYEVVPIKSRQTKAFKEHITDKEKITIVEFNEANRLTGGLLRNEQVLALMKGCETEVPEIKQIGGYAFRAKADMLNRSERRLLDLKTTANLKSMKVSADKYGYDLQCYLYCEMFDVPYQNFKFVAIDKQSLDIGIYDVAESFYERGRKKFNRAIETYKAFFVDMEDIDSYTIRDTLE